MVTKTKAQKQTQSEMHLIKFFDAGTSHKFEMSGQIGIRKADKDGKFLVFEGPEHNVILGMSKKNAHNLWAGWKVKDQAVESNFVDLDRAFALSIEGTYELSKVWSAKRNKAWMILKNVNSDETYMISATNDADRLYMVLVDAEAEKKEEVEKLSM